MDTAFLKAQSRLRMSYKYCPIKDRQYTPNKSEDLQINVVPNMSQVTNQ